MDDTFNQADAEWAKDILTSKSDRNFFKGNEISGKPNPKNIKLLDKYFPDWRELWKSDMTNEALQGIEPRREFEDTHEDVRQEHEVQAEMDLPRQRREERERARERYYDTFNENMNAGVPGYTMDKLNDAEKREFYSIFKSKGVSPITGNYEYERIPGAKLPPKQLAKFGGGKRKSKRKRKGRGTRSHRTRFRRNRNRRTRSRRISRRKL